MLWQNNTNTIWRLTDQCHRIILQTQWVCKNYGIARRNVVKTLHHAIWLVMYQIGQTNLPLNWLCKSKTKKHQWNRNVGMSLASPGYVVILMKFSSPTSPAVVKMTTAGAAGDENFMKIMTHTFQWLAYCTSPSVVRLNDHQFGHTQGHSCQKGF